MDCNDVLSVVVAAILELAAEVPPVPATEANLLIRVNVLCPVPGITLMQLQDAINEGRRRGVLLACTDDDVVVYCVRTNMVELKQSNVTYLAIVSPSLVPFSCPPLVPLNN